MYTSSGDEGESGIDVFESLHTQLGLGGIAPERLIAEDFEKVNEDDLRENGVC